jgi:hypothetical protein
MRKRMLWWLLVGAPLFVGCCSTRSSSNDRPAEAVSTSSASDLRAFGNRDPLTHDPNAQSRHPRRVHERSEPREPPFRKNPANGSSFTTYRRIRRCKSRFSRFPPGQGFDVEDHLDVERFNRALWKGLMGSVPYPTIRSGIDLSPGAHVIGSQASSRRYPDGVPSFG